MTVGTGNGPQRTGCAFRRGTCSLIRSGEVKNRKHYLKREITSTKQLSGMLKSVPETLHLRQRPLQRTSWKEKIPLRASSHRLSLRSLANTSNGLLCSFRSVHCLEALAMVSHLPALESLCFGENCLMPDFLWCQH